MTIFFSLAFALSVAVLLIAHLMEAGAIRNRINGANGLTLFMALYASVAGSVLVALVGWIFSGILTALEVLAFSAAWHISVFKLSTGRLQGLASRSKP